MRTFLFWFVLIPSVIYILRESQDKYAGQIRLNLDDIELPSYVHQVPGGRHNLRSGQLSLTQLDSLFSLGYIKTVIRLNGNSAGSVPISRERTLCDSKGIGFIHINPAGKDAAITVHGLLLDGRTLIHCLTGDKDTGAMLGFHLIQIGYSANEVKTYNGW